MTTKDTRITATAVRKAAKMLGPTHPAVIEWRRVASGRIARINNIDATLRRVAPLGLRLAALEVAKARIIEAAAVIQDTESGAMLD